MTLKDELKQNASLKLENGVFYQADLARQNDFEKMYLSLRQKEDRLYSDEIVKSLPKIPFNHALKNEWTVRRISAEKFVYYLRQKTLYKKILEVGCGNGWFANKMASDLSVEVLALDVNGTELLQGARIFSSERLSFVYGDIFNVNLNTIRFDCIVLPSSIQYFQRIDSLLNHLLRMLTPKGEIHIIDSPLYTSPMNLDGAKQRTASHFESLGFREMTSYYFHHPMQEMGIFNYELLEDPNSLLSTIKRRIFRASHPVFPWIRIKAN